MILKNIKSRQKGFTIVELLVVIVVIGILAAITIVSYTGITTKAKGSQAQANANSIQQVAEAYNADAGYYPKTLAAFNTGYTGGTSSPTAVKPAGITMQLGQPGVATYTGTDLITGANGTNNISWACVAATAATDCTTISPAGGRIEYWDYSNTTPARAIIYVGNATAASTYSITGL